MHTIDYLFGQDAAIFWPPVLVGIIVAILCSVLSPLIVLKRLAFIGQGVSHAAFAGVGIAMVLGLGTSAAADTSGLGDPRVFAIVTLVCMTAALGIAWLSNHRERPDTAIGIVLVSAMALGFLLMGYAAHLHPQRDSQLDVESILFGSIRDATGRDVFLALGVMLGSLFWLWWTRRAVLFWAFDQTGAQASGVPMHIAQTTLLVLISLAIVLTMRLAGVVLATALLVLPGATGLQLGTHLWRVMLISLAAGLAGVVGGLILSFELDDWPAGPSIVLVSVALYAAARLASTRISTPVRI